MNKTTTLLATAATAATFATEGNTATYVDVVTEAGKCFRAESSLYTGHNVYAVNGKLFTVDIPDAATKLRSSERAGVLEDLAAARKARKPAPERLRTIVSENIMPSVLRDFNRGPLKELVALPNVAAARMVVSGNKGKSSVYEDVQNMTGGVVGTATASFQRCQKVRLKNRSDGNEYGSKGFGKDWSPLVRKLTR